MEVLASIGCQRGRVLLFPHDMLHEGTAVESLPKLMLRADVKLGRKGPSHRAYRACRALRGASLGARPGAGRADLG